MSGLLVMLIIPCCILLGVIAIIVFIAQMRKYARRTRLRIPSGLLLQIRMAASRRSSIRIQDSLRSTLASLEESLRWLRKELHRTPGLPASAGRPHIMSLAMDLAVSSKCTASELKNTLSSGETVWEPEEILALPAGIGVALAELLQETLPPPTRIFSQACSCRNHRTDKHIWPEGTLTGDTDQPFKLDLRLLQRIEACFIELRAMNWPEIVEDLDPIHWLMLQDPAGLYPSLTTSGRLMLRRRAARIAADLKTDPSTLLEQLLSISDAAEERSNESHIAWWLMTRDGILRLHRVLTRRHGWLRLLVHTLQPYAYRLLLILLGVIGGLGYLQARQPLLMLPAFLIVSGHIWRSIFRCLQQDNGAELSLQTDVRSVDMRALVVLPAVLAAPADAEARFRRLKHVCTTMENVDADYLLLGDFPASPTVCSGYDTAVICTAADIAASLCGETCPSRFIYIQRNRTRDDIHFTYAPRSGRHGALETICQLVTQGECDDGIYYSTVSPAFLHRRYAFIVVLDEDESPAPDMLEKLLRSAACPLYTPVPTPTGHSGYAAFCAVSANEHDSAAARTMLVYPDAFLSSTEGMIPAALGDNAHQLDMALCGCASVSDAYVGTDPHHDSTLQNEGFLYNSYQTWLNILWQLPWVQTPSGFIRNPLDSTRRFKLREQLRLTLLPAAKLALLFWSLLCGNWLLLSLPIVAMACVRSNGAPLLCRIARLFLLPQDTAASLCGVYQALKRLASKYAPDPTVHVPRTWQTTALCCQVAAAGASLAAGILSPAMLIPAGMLCAGFAGYQAVAGWLDRHAD